MAIGLIRDVRASLERDGCRFVGTEPLPSALGWRCWFVRVSKRGPVRLSSPWIHMATARDGATLVARCDQHAEPPHPDCACGLYGTASLLDALFFAGTAMLSSAWTPEIPHGVLPVLGRVKFSRVLHMLNPILGSDITEIRAGQVDIEELFLLAPTDPAMDVHTSLAERLATTYEVPCTAAYPRYTQADFDTHTPGEFDDGVQLFGTLLVRPADGETISTQHLKIWPPPPPPPPRPPRPRLVLSGGRLGPDRNSVHKVRYR